MTGDRPEPPPRIGCPAGRAGLGHVRYWVFDLDNTLYPPECGLFTQIDARMGSFIAELLSVDAEEARRLQKHYYRTYGTTLRGLMTEHRIDPHAYLEFVHDIDHSPVAADPLLRAAIAALPGRRFVLTNGSRRHAERIVERIGIADLFDDLFDIAAADFEPKPARHAYDRFLAVSRCEPRSSALFEDLARNLEVPHALGMTTVLVRSGRAESDRLKADWELDGADAAHVHHVTEDLAGFLATAAEAVG